MQDVEAEVSQLPCKKLDLCGGRGPKDVPPAPAGGRSCKTTAQVLPRDRLPSGCHELLLKGKCNAGKPHTRSHPASSESPAEQQSRVQA